MSAEAPPGLIARDARELLLSASRGIPRLVSHLLRISLILADERDQPAINPSIVSAAIALLHLNPPTPTIMPPTKPRFDRGPKSRR